MMGFPTVSRRSAAAVAAMALAVGLLRPSDSSAVDGKSVGAFLSDLSAQAARAEKNGRDAVKGVDGWMFFVAELRALTVGPFWGDRAASVSRASNAQNADPLPAIVDFHNQLKKAGIDLLIVPVPAKAAIYPEEILKQARTGTPADSTRLDVNHEKFYALLRAQGVDVLDLVPLFIEQRQSPDPALYCKTDSHWSDRAISVTAQAIEKQIRDRSWLKALPKLKYESESRNVEISGDLARMLDEANPARETLPLAFVGTRKGSKLAPVSPDRDSPVLLMGDSHTLVFHDPELFARGAGLPDHLALSLGFPVDLVGIRGSGATTTRIELLRRRDNLKGKKLVVWCFSFREFTESTTGWRKVPVIR